MASIVLLAACGGPDASAEEVPGVEASSASASAAASSSGNPDGVAPPADAATPQEARVILVTGSTGGLGREVARRLASDGAHVIVHGRSVERGEALVAEIEEEGIGSARFYAADFGSLDEIRRLAADILRDYDRLDVLVNNAGVLTSPDERPLSQDGHELHFQVNYLAGFLLTDLLRPLLEASAPSRIVNVSSLSNAPLDFDDLMLENGYSTGRAYGQSKLAQIMFTISLAERLEGTGVSVYSLHPATFMDTDMVRDFGMTPRTSVDEGADAVMRLVDGEGIESGRHFIGLEPGRGNDQAYDPAARARLWEASERLVEGG